MDAGPLCSTPQPAAAAAAEQAGAEELAGLVSGYFGSSPLPTIYEYGTETMALYSTLQAVGAAVEQEQAGVVEQAAVAEQAGAAQQAGGYLAPLQAAPEADYSGSPPTPPTSPISPPASHQDEVDGWISSALIGAVKTALLHLFNIISLKHLKETCFGCITDHPSQKQHQCLEIPEEDFYQLHFYGITQRLLSQRFIPAVQNLLRQQRIQAEDPVVKIIAETLLHEMKSAFRIQTAITDMYEGMTSDEKLKQLRSVLDCYIQDVN